MKTQATYDGTSKSTQICRSPDYSCAKSTNTLGIIPHNQSAIINKSSLQLKSIKFTRTPLTGRTHHGESALFWLSPQLACPAKTTACHISIWFWLLPHLWFTPMHTKSLALDFTAALLASRSYGVASRRNE
jgi:hypothetical protein